MADLAFTSKLAARLLAVVQQVVLGCREFLGLDPVIRIETAGIAQTVDLRDPAGFLRWLRYQFAPAPAVPSPAVPRTGRASRIALAAGCLLVLGTYGALSNLRGIHTDEGVRLAISNGGESFTTQGPTNGATWARVIEYNNSGAYQPLYFLFLNTLMRGLHRQDVIFLRLINVGFLALGLAGLLALSAGWRLLPRLFALGLFSFNAYLIMHVLSIREYIVGVVFYIWSSWLVLRLVHRPLSNWGADAGLFAAYGGLLLAGFYVQTWVVFPAIGQGLFLLWRRPAPRGRFFAGLSLSYLIVLAATVPYLLGHPGKMEVGRWATETPSLTGALSDGFHLVLAGHVAGAARFTDFLFWFWLVAIAGTGWLLFRPQADSAPGPGPAEARAQALLMLLCSAISLVFQIGYFFKVESLSVWPRYFVIHYFFLLWLVALGFNRLDEWRVTVAAPGPRRALAALLGAMGGIMLASAVYQVRSYHRDPYFDTSLSRTFNWNLVTDRMAPHLRPDDTVIARDWITLATVTFSHPLPNRAYSLDNLPPRAVLQSAPRLVYLDGARSTAETAQLIARLGTQGFDRMQEIEIDSPNGTLRGARLLVFTRE